MKCFRIILSVTLLFLVTGQLKSQWTQCNGVIGGRVFAMVTNTSPLYAGGLDGVYVSSNGGANWIMTSLNNKIIYSLVGSGGNIYAGTLANGIYRSTTQGVSWTQLGLASYDVKCININGSTMLAGTDINSGIFRSSNNGQNWTQTSLNNRSVTSIVYYGSNYFAGTSSAGVYISTNNGLNWS